MSRRSSAATSGQNGRATHWKRGSRVVEHGGGCGGWWRRWRSNLHQPPPTSRTSTNLRRASERERRRAGPPRRDLSRAARGAGRFGGETAAAQAGHDPRRDRPDDQAGPARARSRRRPRARRIRSVAARAVPGRRRQRGRGAGHGAVDLRGVAPGARRGRVPGLARPRHPRTTPLRSEGEERMHVALRMRVAILSGTVLTAVGRGGGARGRAWPPSGPPPEVVKPLHVPESPYYLIYSPPVNLAKPPDTTAHGRKPGS